MGMLGKRLVEVIQHIVRQEGHVVVIHIFVTGLIKVIHQRFDGIAETLLELLAKTGCPQMAGFHFPRIDKDTRLGASVGILQTLVHLGCIVSKRLLIEVIDDASLARMIPSKGTVGRRFLLVEGTGAIFFRQVEGIEWPQGAVSKVATQAQRIGRTLGIVHRCCPLFGKPLRMLDGTVATHRIDPCNLHPTESVFLQPFQLILDILLMDFRSEPPPASVRFPFGIRLGQYLFSLLGSA